jgi:hypothetical protein
MRVLHSPPNPRREGARVYHAPLPPVGVVDTPATPCKQRLPHFSTFTYPSCSQLLKLSTRFWLDSVVHSPKIGPMFHQCTTPSWWTIQAIDSTVFEYKNIFLLNTTVHATPVDTLSHSFYATSKSSPTLPPVLFHQLTDTVHGMDPPRAGCSGLLHICGKLFDPLKATRPSPLISDYLTFTEVRP